MSMQVIHQNDGPARRYDTAEDMAKEGKDGIALILRDHQEVREACNTYKQHALPSAKLLEARRILQLACTHSSIEDRYLYPLINTHLADLSGNMLYERFVCEDRMLKDAIDFVDRHLKPMTEKELEYFDASMLQLIEMLEEHFSSEERFVHEPLKEKMSAKEKAQLYDDFNWGTQTAVTHPHPMAPAITGTSLLHPATAVVDKVWDAVSDRLGGNKEKQLQEMDAHFTSKSATASVAPC